MVHVRLLAGIAVASFMLASASAAAENPPAKGADEEVARNKGETVGDLPLKDGDRILFIGDSIQDQKMWPCYPAFSRVHLLPDIVQE